MSKKLIILASDTLHRRYFIQRILAAGIPVEAVIFETDLVQPKFTVGPFFSEEEKQFETENFFTEFSFELDSIQTFYVSNINNEESATLIKQFRPDTALVFGTRKIQQHIIALFPDPLINVHRGIAQAYRGLDTNLWAVYHEDFSNVGVTIHYVNDRLDTGEILSQSNLIFPEDMRIWQMRYYETLLCAELSVSVLQSYLQDNLQPITQPTIGRYYSFMPLVIKETLPKKLERYLSKLCWAN